MCRLWNGWPHMPWTTCGVLLPMALPFFQGGKPVLQVRRTGVFILWSMHLFTSKNKPIRFLPRQCGKCSFIRSTVLSGTVFVLARLLPDEKNLHFIKRRAKTGTSASHFLSLTQLKSRLERETQKTLENVSHTPFWERTVLRCAPCLKVCRTKHTK